MNIKDSYIHNGEAILKDILVSGSKLQKLKAGKDANDAYLTWVDVLDLSPFGASGHNHDDRYLKLTGGTLALGEGLKFHADENYFGTNLDARIISLLDGNGATCDGGLIIDERATSNGVEHITELLRIRDSEFKWKGNTIWHEGNDGSGSSLDADLLDGKHSTDFLGWSSRQNIGSGSPFQDAVNFFNNLSNLNNGGKLVYNSAGEEYTELFTRRNDSTAHGTILKWGYADKYIRIIRMINGTAQSTDWEKISAGYADSAGSATTSTYASNVGTSGTAGTNYVTASKIISACNWYDTMIGSDSDKVINRWSEIVDFVAGFEETPNLATFLSNNYLAKSGGTMTGDITFSNDNKISWSRNTDTAEISFKNNGNDDSDSYMLFQTTDDNNEYFKWRHINYSGTSTDYMNLKSSGLSVLGSVTSSGFKKSESDDSYVLLGGGGHKALSDFMSSTIKYALSDSIGGKALLSYKLYYSSDVLTDLNSIDNFHEALTFKYTLWNANADSMKTSYPGAGNGIILSGGWSSATYGFQLAIDDDPNYFIALRQRGNGTWAAWKRIPMGDGTGASGTWNINISGNAGSVAWENITNKPATATGYGYIGKTAVQASSAEQALSGITTINGRLSINAESDNTRLGFGGMHDVTFGEPGYAHREYYFRPAYGSSGVTYTSLTIQNASAATSPTFTTTHRFDYNGNVYHSGNVGIGTASPSYKLDVNGTLNATRILINSATYGSDSLTVGGCIRITGGSGSGHAAGLRRVYFGDGNNCCLGEGGSGKDTDWMYIRGYNKILFETNNGSTTIDINGYLNSSGFIKTGSDNNYVLLGGGGHSHLSNLQWFTWKADLSSLPNTNYYPVLVNNLPNMRRIRIRINGENPANFSEREDGMCYIWLTEEISGSGWSGTSGLSRIIHGHEEWGGNGKAILVKISQMTNSSKEVFWLRGGAKYNISSDYYGLSITCGENSYTYNSQTVNYIQGLRDFIKLTEVSDSYEGTVTGAKVWYANNAVTATNVAWSGITHKPTFTTWEETSHTATYSLSNAAWTNTISLSNATVGSYILNITSGNSTLTGVFSIGVGETKDEISLHLNGNGPRLYARTNGTTLQLSSSDTNAISRSVTIKYRRMI